MRKVFRDLSDGAKCDPHDHRRASRTCRTDVTISHSRPLYPHAARSCRAREATGTAPFLKRGKPIEQANTQPHGVVRCAFMISCMTDFFRIESLRFVPVMCGLIPSFTMKNLLFIIFCKVRGPTQAVHRRHAKNVPRCRNERSPCTTNKIGKRSVPHDPMQYAVCAKSRSRIRQKDENKEKRCFPKIGKHPS